ncbi:MAG: RICIN domain-containing protein [Candidatus Eremiobacteraeota bacterium]|nr:RICIN domain-containing protein [Candidatus Eremiobacteraeota bacterium]
MKSVAAADAPVARGVGRRARSLTGVSQIQSGTAYSIVNQLSSMALDDTNASTSNGTKIQEWSCNGYPQQNWTITSQGGGIYTIVNQLSGKALDDTNASTANGNQMQQWSPDGYPQQNWTITSQGGGIYTIVNQLSGKALDAGASMTNGAIMQQWDRNGYPQQNWIIVPAGSCNGFPVLTNTPYTLVNQQSSLALDDTNASTANGTRMQQWNCDGYGQQNWVLTPVNNGGYSIVNQLSGKALDNGSSVSNGAPIVQQSATGGQQQSWFLIPGPAGSFIVVNQLSGKAVDVPSASLANGTALQQWDRDGFPQQNWTFVPAGSCAAKSGFSILIDTNQMNNTEAMNDAPLAADGVWSIPVNSCSGCIADPITDPNGTWPGALARLNAANWTVTEDTYDTSGYYPSAQLTAQYIGRAPNASMVYHEQNTPNGTVLLTSEIDNAAAWTGNSIIVLSRSYTSNLASYVDAALGDGHTSGAAFETNPPYASISGQYFNQGIQDILSSGRRAYMLLPPVAAGGDYLSDMQSGVTQYLASSSQFGNPNLFIVLAIYGRPQSGVGFLQPEPGASSGNSVLAVRNWLYSYRSTTFRNGH